MIDKKLIKKHIEHFLLDSDKFLVEVKISSTQKINIIIDGDHGVTIADCVSLSKYIESQFDREKEDYELEVSSFGLDEPIVSLRQYQKRKGKMLMVVDTQDQVFRGLLTELDESGIVLELDLTKKQIREKIEKIKKLKFTEIKIAKSIITFK